MRHDYVVTSHLEIEMLTTMFAALIREEKCTVRDIAIALNNACIHGEIFATGITDAGLARLYEGIEHLMEVTTEESLNQ
jgi:hypothetical protein